MDRKRAVWIGMILGSTLGGFIPDLWGASYFSFSSLFLSSIGAIAGIYIAFKLSE
jgi:Na+/H+-dicarboxylate symporter